MNRIDRIFAKLHATGQKGLMPFLNPGAWRQLFARLLAMSDGQLRFLGLASLACGALLLLLL